MAKVNVHREGLITRVELDRPDKHNGVDLDLIDELLAAAASVKKDRTVRAVIIHGAGPSFSAGLDIKAVLSQPAKAAWAAMALLKPTANRFQRVNLCWRDLSVPVIAAIHGNCFGAGLQLALGADIRVATPDARLSVMEAKWGLVPDMGATVLLREVVSKDVALDLTMSARVVTGQDALGLGLVTRLADDPLAAARVLAEEYAARSPDVVAAGKHLLHQAWDADEASALGTERRWQVRMLRGRNQRIAVRRNTKDPDEAWLQRSW